jgi:hypothetical protein
MSHVFAHQGSRKKLRLDERLVEFVMMEALMPAQGWEQDVVACLVQSMWLPQVSTDFITVGKIFVCLETLLTVGCKPESIGGELHHIVLRLLMVSLNIGPCPNTVRSIVGLTRQYFFVVVHVMFPTEAPKCVNAVDIPSVGP